MAFLTLFDNLVLIIGYMFMNLTILKIITHKGIKYLPGQKVNVKCDDYGIPLDSFWRKRLKDSQIDNCLEITKTKKGK